MFNEIKHFYMFVPFAMTMRILFRRNGWFFRAISTDIQLLEKISFLITVMTQFELRKNSVNIPL
jgi:hypothetical protein